MTNDELEKIAAKKGLIKWKRSGKIEQVKLTRDGRRVLATSIMLPDSQHILSLSQRQLALVALNPLVDIWRCTEVLPTDLVTGEELLPSKEAIRSAEQNHKRWAIKNPL